MGRSKGAAGASGGNKTVETDATTSDAGGDGAVRDAENGGATATAPVAAGSNEDDAETAQDLSTRSGFAPSTEATAAASTRPGAFHVVPNESLQSQVEGQREQMPREGGQQAMIRRLSERTGADHTIATAYVVEEVEDGGEGGGRSIQPMEVSTEPVHEAKVVLTLCGGKWGFRFYCRWMFLVPSTERCNQFDFLRCFP